VLLLDGLMVTLLPYMIAVFMPSWVYLFVYALSWVCLLFVIVHFNIPSDKIDGPAGVVVYILLGYLMISAWAGILARIVSLALRARNYSLATTRLPLFVGYPALLGALFILFLYGGRLLAIFR
jgi:hypothetical protein